MEKSHGNSKMRTFEESTSTKNPVKRIHPIKMSANWLRLEHAAPLVNIADFCPWKERLNSDRNHQFKQNVLLQFNNPAY